MGNTIFDGGDGFQVYLIFQSVHKYIKIIANTRYISEWKAKRLSDESIKPFPTSDKGLTPLIDYYGYNIRVNFNFNFNVLLSTLIIKKDILVLGKGPTRGLEHTLTAEKMYSINFTVTKKEFCLSLHYNGANSYLFVNGKEIVKFKAKDSKF